MAKLDEETYKLIKRSIIRKLYSTKCWGKGHMLIERFKHGLPNHFKGDVEDVLKDLIKQEIVIPYGKTKYGFAVHLNIKKIREIEEIVKSDL